MLTSKENAFLERAIELSRHGMTNEHGGPFGSVIVKGDEIVGEGCNMVIATNDPTAHAEIVAIRDACRRLKAFQLQDCDIYTSCEPCPMCLGAIYWARPNRVIYANTRFDAAAIEFDDDFIYQQINTDMLQRTIPFIHEPHPLALQVFDDWRKIDNKKLY
ncbi:MAG TPA: nucleoside deaminase [Chitinophagaceae bacterium]|jgi:guanine deaminase|nr:nucleoside deaminase [Chitinophagaceae bacterium]